MCLDHIIAHEAYYFYLALPLKPAPTCFTKQHGTSELKNSGACFFLGLPTEMFNIWGL